MASIKGKTFLPTFKGCSLQETSKIFYLTAFFYAGLSSVAQEELNNKFIKAEIGAVNLVNVVAKIIFVFTTILFFVNLSESDKMKKLRNTFMKIGAVVYSIFAIAKIVIYILIVSKLHFLDAFSKNDKQYTDEAKKSLKSIFILYSVYNAILIIIVVITLLYIIQTLILGEEECENKEFDNTIDNYLKIIKNSSIFGFIYTIICILCEILFLFSIKKSTVTIFIILNSFMIIGYCILYSGSKHYDIKKTNRSLSSFIIIMFFFYGIKYVMCSMIFDDQDETEYSKSVNSFSEYIKNNKMVEKKYNYRTYIVYYMHIVMLFYFAVLCTNITSLGKIIDEDKKNRNLESNGNVKK